MIGSHTAVTLSILLQAASAPDAASNSAAPAAAERTRVVCMVSSWCLVRRVDCRVTCRTNEPPSVR